MRPHPVRSRELLRAAERMYAPLDPMPQPDSADTVPPDRLDRRVEPQIVDHPKD